MSAARRRATGQAGMVAGGDGLLFGMLILIAGSLALVNVWAIIDTRAALDAAAREYLRTYTEQRDPAGAAAEAHRAARSVLDSRGTPLRCSPDRTWRARSWPATRQQRWWRRPTPSSPSTCSRSST